MFNKTLTRTLCAVLALLMIASLFTGTILTVNAATVVYTLDPGELETFSKGEKADGDTVRAGTDGYFTVFFSATAQVQVNGKDFSDGYTSKNRIHYSAPSHFGDTVKNAVRIKTYGAATVKVWWGCGDKGRQIAIFNSDGSVLTQTNEDLAKNELCISELSIPAAGTYYIGNIVGNNYHYKIEVTETEVPDNIPPRASWDQVAAPKIRSVQDNGKGELKVTVDAVVGHDGGDELVVTMYDKDGTIVDRRTSVLEQEQHIITFTPEASGTFTFQAILSRYGEEYKTGKDTPSVSFSYPLASPILVSATSAGNGSVKVVWEAVKEAECYEVYCDGVLAATTADTAYTVEGLTIDQKYSFTVSAVRSSERTAQSNPIAATAFQDARQPWGFTYYGPSTNQESNGYIGDVNEDGKVTVYSENGKGKIVPASVDGVAFYYTAVSTELNFTLRAKITVDSWTLSNGQEGFGLLATDRLGPTGNSGNFWNNQYMVGATKIEYRYDSDLEAVVPLEGSGTKYSMKLGLGTIVKTGVTPENLALLEASDTKTINEQFLSRMTTLESAAGYWGKEGGTYNVIGNGQDVSGSIENAMLTEFILEIQKNNTGYFVSYYDAEGNLLSQQKYYGPDDLSQLDPDYVYVGFFAARNARVTFSDVTFTTILASEDAPAEEKPVTWIDPTVVISSPTVTTSLEYPLSIDANVSGTVTVLVERETVLENIPVTGGIRYNTTVSLKDYGDNHIRVQFTPDPDQDLGEDTKLSSTSTAFADIDVTCNKGFYHRKTIYVSPDGLPNGAGTKENPFDIYTAANNAVAGQCIVLMGGTYKLKQTLRIQRGMDGTEDAPIRMIADPDAASRPVLDFQGECAGIVHGGDYWYFYGFDVTNSLAGQKGFQVSGNHNTLDQINAYNNGNTGIQISRYSGTDLPEDWPAYNLILNCTSYNNADPGYEDADGFACKLTSGEGNVFDGCVAYHNADDGWDMYAKVETGPIGSVIVRNCVAYENGYVMENGTLVEGGNGNGFKMGGESLSGKHILENSYAFFNKSKGIDSNSCPDVIVKNCTSYNNGTYNVALYTSNAPNTSFDASGILSFKDSTITVKDALTMGDNLKPKGSQNTTKFQNDSTYYWDGTASCNSAGASLSADMFVSLKFAGVVRNADGTLDLQGFLEKAAAAPVNAGAAPGGTASLANTALEAELEHNYSETWYNEDTMFHWHECECGDRGDFAAHTFTWIVDKEATETTNGKKHEECTVCGYKRPAIETYFGEVIPGLSDDPQVNEGDPAITTAVFAAVVAVIVGCIGILRKKKK